MLAQALPPLWLMALSAYLLVGVPLALSVSVVIFITTFSPLRRRRLTRRASVVTFLVGVGNGIAAAYWLSLDQNPVAPNVEDRIWAAMMVLTVVLSALAWWRAG